MAIVHQKDALFARNKFGDRMKKSRLFIAVCALAFSPCLALAQASANTPVQQSDGKTIFAPDFFEAFNPVNALEMVSRIPGFSVSEGNRVRGLAGSNGNVLIDGTRPSSKDSDLDDVLAAIPKAQVERIELLQGAALGSLGQGYAMIVNIVRKDTNKPNGTIAFEASLTHHNILAPILEFNYGGKVGSFNYNFKIDGGKARSIKRLGGEGLVNNQGVITEFGPNFDHQQVEFGSVSATLDGKIGQTKAKFDFSYRQYLEDRPWQVFATRAGENSVYRIDSGRDVGRGPDISFGTIFESPMFGYDAKLNLIARREVDDDVYDAGFNLVNRPKRFTRFSSYSQVDEFAGQIEMAKKFGKHSISFGGETGVTSLDAESNFYNNIGNGFIIDPSGRSLTNVKENRSEAFIADTWAISPRLSIEGKLRNEWSKISQSGDKPKERDFSYLKPLLSINFAQSPNLIFNAKYEKILGQLNFNDFAFSASLDDQSQNLGNSELRPAQIDNREISIERKWDKRGTFKVTYFDRDIKDAVTTVPVFENGNIIGEAVGNIPEGHRIGILTSLTLPLDFLLKGLEVKSDWQFTEYYILDPFTNKMRERPFEGARGFEFEVNYNNEARKYGYGAFYARGERNADYQRFNSYLWPPSSFWGIWGEYKGFDKWTLSANLELPNGLRIWRYRTDYLVSRADGRTNGGHLRYRDLKPAFNLEIRRAI